MTHRKADHITNSTEESYQHAENLVQEITKIWNKINGEISVCGFEVVFPWEENTKD